MANQMSDQLYISSDMLTVNQVILKRSMFLEEFLNQARAWFIEITSVRMYVCVYVCVCVSAPEAMNN